jgi:hypothetical protein
MPLTPVLRTPQTANVGDAQQQRQFYSGTRTPTSGTKKSPFKQLSSPTGTGTNTPKLASRQHPLAQTVNALEAQVTPPAAAISSPIDGSSRKSWRARAASGRALVMENYESPNMNEGTTTRRMTNDLDEGAQIDTETAAGSHRVVRFGTDCDEKKASPSTTGTNSIHSSPEVEMLLSPRGEEGDFTHMIHDHGENDKSQHQEHDSTMFRQTMDLQFNRQRKQQHIEIMARRQSLRGSAIMTFMLFGAYVAFGCLFYSQWAADWPVQEALIFTICKFFLSEKTA